MLHNPEHPVMTMIRYAAFIKWWLIMGFTFANKPHEGQNIFMFLSIIVLNLRLKELHFFKKQLFYPD